MMRRRDFFGALAGLVLGAGVVTRKKPKPAPEMVRVTEGWDAGSRCRWVEDELVPMDMQREQREFIRTIFTLDFKTAPTNIGILS